MPFLTDSAPPSYNGYTFPTTVETTAFDQEPIVDESNRTFLYVKYRISLRWHVIAVVGSNIDTDMESIRLLLMQRGGAFDYRNRGMGDDFLVNSNGSMFDVNGGPLPLSFSFKPKGKNQGCTLDWTLELCVPNNCAVAAYNGTPMVFNWRLKQKIDQNGYSTRTIIGHVAVPKITNDTMTGDEWLEQIIPPVPNGCVRVDRDYDHTFDKKRMDFVVVDRELTSRALPWGCTAATASHFIRNSDRGTPYMFQWEGVLQASYHVDSTNLPDVAWFDFKRLLDHRLNIAKNNLTLDLPADADLQQQKPPEKSLLMIVGYSFGEPEIYGTNNVTFEVTYTAVHSLKAILGDDGFKSGMYRYPVQGQTAWDEWIASVALTQGRARGWNGGPLLQGTQDVLIDLCVHETPQPPVLEAAFGPGDLGIQLEDLQNMQPDPDEDASWFMWNPELEIYEDSHAVVSSSLTEEAWSPYEQSPGDMAARGYVPDEKPTDPTDQVQYRAPSTLYVYIAGEAMRAWFPIPRPKIVSYNGLQVKEISTEADGCYFMQKTVGNLGIGLPIFYAKWRFKYVVEARPAEPIRPPLSRSEQQ